MATALGLANGAVFAAGAAAWLYRRAQRDVYDTLVDTPVTLRVGGVPEHFNLPFKDAIAPLGKRGVHIEWHEQPGGTGAMTKGLREDKLDVVIALTEGIVADLVNNNPSQLVAQYVQSPLRWGVHVSAKSAFNSIAELRGRRFGVSRMGSGSHLMSFVLAREHGWDLTNIRLVIVGSLEQAREAMADHRIDAFMWEEFTTKPLVYSGEWRCVGVCTTPWPCFVVAVRNDVLAAHPRAIRLMMDVVRERADAFKADPAEAARRVVAEFGIKLEDARAWIAITEWSCKLGMDLPMLQNCAAILRAVGVLKPDGGDAAPPLDVSKLVARWP
jgi:ABC-type nitrate/sulfonate/bicarbonate transport system substrate-binding protein